MRHPRLIPVLLLIIITSLATPLQAQIVLKGKITTEKNEPVAFAPVILQQLPDTTRYTEGVITDMAGNYRFGKHRAGRYLLSVRTIGYKTLYDTVLLRKPSIGMTEVVRDYVLSEDVAEIDAVVVTANNTASYFDRTVYTITNEDRNVNFLKEIVNRIYADQSNHRVRWQCDGLGKRYRLFGTGIDDSAARRCPKDRILRSAAHQIRPQQRQ